VDLISHNLASTYEEISLLYTVTQNLRISRSDEELGQLAIDWLAGESDASSWTTPRVVNSRLGETVTFLRA
jgi:hypothetical protein